MTLVNQPAIAPQHPLKILAFNQASAQNLKGSAKFQK